MPKRTGRTSPASPTSPKLISPDRSAASSPSPDSFLEEIVGEFTTDPASGDKDIMKESQNTFLVDGATNIREMNRAMDWTLPTDGPKTLNGLIVEFLETIPEPGTRLNIEGYPIEIVETNDNRVMTARIYPHEEAIEATAD